MNHLFLRICGGCLLVVGAMPSFGAEAVKPRETAKEMTDNKAPSMQKVRWTEAKVSSDFDAEYDYVGGQLNEHYTDFRYTFTRRSLLAFLIHGGLEWQRYGFDGRDDLLVPGQLETVNAFVALDFRWSKKDLLRIQSRPGLFSDFEDIDINDFHAPVDIAYTRVPSHRFQWVVGISVDPWRKYRVLPGGGFRYQINDLWKLKLLLPQPQLEYKALDNLHVFVGADLRGDTFRLAKDFGTAHGDMGLNNALVDYSEVRAGLGFSWNIKPLIELNMRAGVLLRRQFDYHNNGVTFHNGGDSPYISISFHQLFKLAPPERTDLDTRGGRFRTPALSNILKFL